MEEATRTALKILALATLPVVPVECGLSIFGNDKPDPAEVKKSLTTPWQLTVENAPVHPPPVDNERRRRRKRRTSDLDGNQLDPQENDTAASTTTAKPRPKPPKKTGKGGKGRQQAGLRRSPGFGRRGYKPGCRVEALRENPATYRRVTGNRGFSLDAYTRLQKATR